MPIINNLTLSFRNAQAIASGILGTLDEEHLNQEPEDHSIYYRVQTGSFRDRSNADRMLYELLDRGFPAFLLHQDGLYKVQVGAFRVLENAVKMEQSLRRAGYSTFPGRCPAFVAQYICSLRNTLFSCPSCLKLLQ